MTGGTSNLVLQFGSCVLECGSARLKRDGHIVPLTPKAYDMLLYLAQHCGQLVTKEELFEALWKDVFVGDAALKVCVREIRRALADDAKNPRYIETAHRRGYRFIAEVSSMDGVAPLTHAAAGAVAARAVVATPVYADARTSPAPSVHVSPQTRYARSGEVNIAYQVIGEGPIDLVFVMGWVSHLDCFWTEPSFARFLRRLAEFSRVILFDKRGTGLSDRVVALPTLEERMDDVRAVMADAGSHDAVLLGISEGGPLCSLFATTYPEKTRALVMIGTYAKRLRSPDYPWAPTREAREHFFQEIRTEWGGPIGIETRAPSRAADPAFRAWWSTYLRQGASPGAALALTQMNAEIDVRHVLPLVRVPTLVLHRTGDRCLLVEEGRYVASLVPNATFVELPGDDHLPFVGDQDAIVETIASFVSSSVPAVPADRTLATILCASLEPAAAAGRDAFEEQVRHEVAWFRGRGVTFTSSGLTAAFDGPARAISCASAIAAAAPRFSRVARFGLHTGECDQAPDGSVTGTAVELAHKVCASARAGEVLVSRTVTDLVSGSGLEFEERELRTLTDAGDMWRLFAVVEPGSSLRGAAAETVASPVPRTRPPAGTRPRAWRAQMPRGLATVRASSA